MDALIEELQSDAGDDIFGEDADDAEEGASAKPVPEELLQTDPSVGLTSDQVLQRRKKYGLNQMSEEQENLILKFIMFFIGPIQFVMEGAAILAAGLEDWVDFGVICGLLMLNACVGFIQEFQAGSIVEELKKTLALGAVVVRDGRDVEIEAPEVVPGDILKLEEGTIIPADGRIVTPDCFLQIDQSALTGESLAVDKHFGDNTFASSSVKRGEGFMIVTSTGDNTFVGRAAALVNKASGGQGHFTEVLNGIGTTLLVLVIITLLVVWISTLYRSVPIVEILRYTLAITIVGVPVGLPAVVTTTMAVGAAYLAKKEAIVQKLSAIESLAGVEILCSDKTGTLTKNKLSLAEPFTVEGVDADDLMLTACLAATRKAKGLDAIDKAFLKSLKMYPRAKSTLTKYKVVEFHPFDPVSKKVVAVVESPPVSESSVLRVPLFSFSRLSRRTTPSPSRSSTTTRLRLLTLLLEVTDPLVLPESEARDTGRFSVLCPVWTPDTIPSRPSRRPSSLVCPSRCLLVMPSVLLRRLPDSLVSVPTSTTPTDLVSVEEVTCPVLRFTISLRLLMVSLRFSRAQVQCR